MGYRSKCGGGSAVSTCESCKKGTSVQNRSLKVFRLEDLARATNSFSAKNLLGKGSHACVYKAVLSDGQVVAVKRPTVGRRNLQDVSSFDNELEVLSKLQHHHIVNLIGYCNEGSEKLLVVEFMANGTLFDLLHCSKEPLSWPMRVQMALQAAKAILALHSASPPIIHRDIKSSNILVDGEWNAKLGDLGLALRGHLEDVVRQRTPPAGTMGYIDPEYETPSQLSTKSDVFSFGILLLEIMSGRNAIDVRFNPSSIVDWAVPLIKQGKSLSLCDPALKPPHNAAKAVKQLAAIAARSVRLSRERRPTMAEIVEGLREIRRRLPVPRFGGKPARNTITSRGNIKAEVSDDFGSDGGASFQSTALSILGEGSVLDDGDASPANSVKSSSHSVLLNRRRRRGLSDSLRFIDNDFAGEPVSPAPSSGATPPPSSVSRKIEQPLFDPPKSSSRSMRMDMVHSLSPLSSPMKSQKDGDRSGGRRPLESPTFGSQSYLRSMDHKIYAVESGSKGPMRTSDPRTSSVESGSKGPGRQLDSRTSAGESGSKGPVRTMDSRAATVGEKTASGNTTPRGSSRFRLDEKNVSQPTISPRRNSNLVTLRRTSSVEEASLASPHLPDGRSGSNLPTNDMTNENGTRHTDLPQVPKQVKDNDKSHRAMKAPKGELDTKAHSNGSSSVQLGRFTMDSSPMWSSSASALKYYSNAESPFGKVDVPIAV